MLILSTTSDKIQIVLGTTISTTQMSCYASYRDTTSSSITPLRNDVLTNSTSQVDLVGSPASSTQRVVDYLSVYNSDTVGNRVTIRFFDGTNGYRLFVSTINAGEKIEYQEGFGFKVISNGYSIKLNTTFDTPGTASTVNMSISDRDFVSSPLAAPTTIMSTGYTQVDTLKVPMVTGRRIWFRWILWFDANATTTGHRFNIFGSVGHSSYLHHNLRVSTTSTTETFLTCGAEYFYTRAIVANSAATTGNVAIIEGIVRPEKDGFLIPCFTSELATPNSITVKADSFVQWQITS